jgi:CBS domain-containing protein
MTAPLVTVREDTPVYEAIYRMIDRQIGHLPVRDNHGKITGILNIRQLLTNQTYSYNVIRSQIENSENLADLKNASRKIPLMTRYLIESEFNSDYIMKFISGLNDLIIKKAVEFALRKTGEPPVPFSLIVFGSLARQEQTLTADQDNGIVYENSENNHEKYFMELGIAITAILNDAGFYYCPGNTMARNPDLNQPLQGWQNHLNRKISHARPQDILDLLILSDFRSVYGDAGLARSLKMIFQETIIQSGPFFHALAAETANLRLPLDLFGNLITGLDTEHPHHLDIKAALLPLINTALILSLYYRIEESNTLGRLFELHRKQIIAGPDFEALKTAFLFLNRLRLENQKDQRDYEDTPTRLINPKNLPEISRMILKKSINQISLFQNKLKDLFSTGK